MEKFNLKDWPGFFPAGGNVNGCSIIDQIEIDSRRIESKHSLFIALPGSLTHGHEYVATAAMVGAAFAIVEKNWSSSEHFPSLQLLRVDNPLKALQEITAVHRKRLTAEVLGITGSYGKTLLKDLLYKLLSKKKKTFASPESFNSQIGVPLSLLQVSLSDEIALIEAGISKHGEMENLSKMIAPSQMILTNIESAHLSTLGSLEETAKEKMKLISSRNPDWIIIPKTPLIDPQAVSFYHWDEASLDLPYARFESTSPGKGQNATKSFYVKFPDGQRVTSHITQGKSYLLDIINIAIKAAWLFKIPKEVIIEVLRDYRFEPLRTETWRSPTNITFINGGYTSDPSSFENALSRFNQPARKNFLLFDGLRKESPLKNSDALLAKAISKNHIDHVTLYGAGNQESFKENLRLYSPTTTISTAGNFEEALVAIKKLAKERDTVLVKGSTKEPLEKILHFFNDSVCNNQCLINLSSIKYNIDLFKSLQPLIRLMIIVKASAYGTDGVRIAQFLANNGIDILGVSYVEEGVALRRNGFTKSIFTINAAAYEASQVVEHDLEASVSNEETILALAKEAKQARKKLKVHLHVDTGMNRFGCRPEEALKLAKIIQNDPNLKFEGIMTHFSTAENEEEDDFTALQIKKFDEVIFEVEKNGIFPKWKHAANSAALMRFKLPQYNMARIGLAAYGLNPSKMAQEKVKLQLALSLTTRIVGMNRCKKGESISYGRSYKVEKDEQTIAILPIGYFDGLHRNYSGQGEVIIHGKKAPMVGNICMDFMMVDVTDIPTAAVGDSVLIFGYDDFGNYLSPETLADKGNSIVHELITCLGPRIERIFINE